MSARSSLERQLLLGYLLPITCIVLVTALAVMAFVLSLRADALVVHTHAVLTEAQRLQLQESQVFLAYQQALLSRRTQDQQAYRQARDGFSRQWLKLYAAVSDNPAQQGRLRSWHRDFTTWDETVARPALQYAATRERTIPPDLRRLRADLQLASTFIRVEENLLQKRRAALDRVATLAFGAILLGLPLAALLFWVLGRRSLRRVRQGTGELMRATERVTAGDLTVRVPLIGHDELTQLSAHFNAMTQRLQTVVGEQQELQHALEHRVDTLVQGMTREMQLLGQLGTFMQACQDEREAEDVICRTAEALFPSGGEIALLAASRNLLETRMHWGEGTMSGHVFGPEDCWALRLGRFHAVHPGSTRPGCSHTPGERSVLCLPLTAQGDTLGVVTLYFPDGEALEQAHALARRFTERVALSLANLRLRATLRQQSIRDPMTGLYNRRYLEETGARELARAGRHGQPLSVLMIDVDHFKQLNDTHGHALGDAVLRRLATHLQRFFRAEDVVCRYGGEEFVVLLPDCGEACARQRAEALRQSVENLAVSVQDTQPVAITVSLGLASWNGTAPAPVPEDLLGRADAALYQAKRGGRNRVVLAPPAPASHQPAL